MCIRDNICDGGSWMKCFRIAQNGEFCISGDRLCARNMWYWLTAFGSDPKHAKETAVLLQDSFAKE
jgi:hypothetical protein